MLLRQLHDLLCQNLHTVYRIFRTDESIKIKNLDAKRTQRIMKLGKMAAHKLILNGSPMTRDLLDLYPQMQFLSPKILNMSLAQFKDTFCKYTTITRYSGGYGRGYTKEFITGYKNIDYLYSLIRHYVFECDLELNIRQLYEEKHYKIDDEAKEIYYKLKEKYLDNEMLQFKNNNIFLEMTMKMQHEYCCTESKFEVVGVQLLKWDLNGRVGWSVCVKIVVLEFPNCRFRFADYKNADKEAQRQRINQRTEREKS